VDLLPYAVRSRHSVAVKTIFPSAEAVLRAVLAGECALRRAEGVRIAYIGKTIFINGEVQHSFSTYSLIIRRSVHCTAPYVYSGLSAAKHCGLQRYNAGRRAVR
jgi:hypothetical protein